MNMKQLPAGSGKRHGRQAVLVALLIAVALCSVFFFSRDTADRHEAGRVPKEGADFEFKAGDNATALMLKAEALIANFELIGVTDTGGLYPPEYEAYGHAATKRDRAEVLNEAVRDLERAVQLDPNLARAYHLLGSARFLQGNAEAGAQAYREALRRNPTDVNTHVGFVILLAESGKAQEADAALEQFERLFPVEFETSMTLQAVVGLNAGRYRRSGAAASDLLALDPEDVWARQVLALSLDGLGRTEAADKEWSRLAETAPDRREEFRKARQEWAQRRKK